MCIGGSTAEPPPDPIRTAPVKFVDAVRRDRRAHTEAGGQTDFPSQCLSLADEIFQFASDQPL